eukprot:2911312-Rhodomonas_salina.2
MPPCIPSTAGSAVHTQRSDMSCSRVRRALGERCFLRPAHNHCAPVPKRTAHVPHRKADRGTCWGCNWELRGGLWGAGGNGQSCLMVCKSTLKRRRREQS